MKFETIQAYLKESFENWKDRECIRHCGHSYTYETLDKESSQMALCLQEAGVKKGDFVGVFTEDRYDVIVSMAGIWKLGAVFVPLDQEYPIARLIDMVTIPEIHYLVCDKNPSCQLLLDSCKDVNAIPVDTIKTYDTSYMENAILPEDSIYLYFTSGTTGKPKPILGVNKGLAHFIDWEIQQFAITETDAVSQLTSPCHDPFLRDVLVPLCSGAVLCIPESKEAVLNGIKLRRWVEEEEISLIHCTPSLFSILQDKGISEEKFQKLRYILLAGERILPQMLTAWFRVFGERIQLVNMYGPTETTLAKFFYLIREEDLNRNHIPIGQPIKGAQAILLDEKQKPCGKGIMGEIYIRTPYRTKGYYKDEQLTKEKFVVNPFGKREDDLLFKTGDLARVRADGNFEFCGRIDRQVKIRGFRVELSAIENALLQLEDVKEAAVVFEQNLNTTLLKAFVVVEESQKTESERIKELARELPDYMVPNRIFVLDAMPITSNNKTDYKALEEYEEEAKEEQFVFPQTETQMRVHAIFAELLEKEMVSIDKTFLMLGGNSLNAMRLIGAVQEQFQVELPLGVVFEKGSIEGISEFIDTSVMAEEEEIEKVEEAEYYLASPYQKYTYFLVDAINNIKGENTIYNMVDATVIKGKIDKVQIEKAVNQVIKRHEALRTIYFKKDGEVYQKIIPHVVIDVPCMKIKEEEVDDAIYDFRQPFDFEHGPLVRAMLLEIHENYHYFLLDIHHAIGDGRTMVLFAKEVMELCAGKELPPVEIQYKDYAKWRNDQEETARMLEAEAYWVDCFEEDKQDFHMPTDFTMEKKQPNVGLRYYQEVPSDIAKKIEEMAKSINVTLSMVYYTAYLILLNKYSGQDDLTIGIPVDVRYHKSVQDCFGLFVNVIPFRNRVSQTDRIKNLIPLLARDMEEAFEYGEYASGKVKTKLKEQYQVAGRQLFDTCFGYYDYGVPKMQLQDITYEEYPIKKLQAKDEMLFSVIVRPDKVTVFVEYCIALYKEETIHQYMNDYMSVLEQICNKDSMIRDIHIGREE